MSTFERPGEGLSGFDFTELEPSIEETLVNIVVRRSAQAKEAGVPYFIHTVEPDLEMTVDTPIATGDIKLLIRSRTGYEENSIPIGYFSPATGKPVLYPECVEDEETEIITDAAFARRIEVIEKFNGDPNKKRARIDYTPEPVRELHLDHNAFLEGRILFDVLHKHNDARRDTPDSNLLVDSSTVGAICLRPNLASAEKTAAHFISLRVLGGYTEKNEFRSRPKRALINIAERDTGPDADDEDFNPVERLIENYEVDDMIERAKQVADMYDRLWFEGLEFDLEELGVRLHPQAS